MILRQVLFPDVNYSHAENGIITSAGISAGIDMTLHLIKVIMGEQIADDSARRMEYHWIRDSEQDEFSLKSAL